MVGWHHQFNEYVFEQNPRDSVGWGSWACYSPWSGKELDMTEQEVQVDVFSMRPS